MRKNGRETDRRKTWPADCIWPDPTSDGDFWEAEFAEGMPLDEEAQELLDIREYYDEMVEEGRLNEDYSLNEDYEDWVNGEDAADGEEEPWEPEKGEDYWNDGFDVEAWEEDLADRLNLLKLPLPSPVEEIQRIIGYEFINENLLRQAFTRRAFGIEYEVGDSEVLELIGDAVLNTVVTREITRQLTEQDVTSPGSPFSSSYDEGDLSRIRQHYICREYLAERATALGLDQYILYGSGEEPGDSGREDMMEALLGAVAADCEWDWHTLEGVADRLLTIQLSEPRSLLQLSSYDMFNSWHQKRFGRMPEYEVSKGTPTDREGKSYRYTCTLRYFVPENGKGIWTDQRVDVQGNTRSEARTRAATEAYLFLVRNGLWMNLKDAGIEPRLEDAINQLQELYQKKYVEKPEYVFEERNDGWHCTCLCSGVEGFGKATGKTAAKKKAAFVVLVHLMMSAG